MSNRAVIRHRKRGVKGTHPLLVSFKGRGRSGDINLTLRPGRDAGTKQDFRDLHRDKMRERKIHRYTRQINVRGPWYWKTSKHDDAEYRNRGIWPKGKTVNAGRMLSHG